MKYVIPLLLLGSMACCQNPTDHFMFRGSIPGAKDSTRVRLYPKNDIKSFSGYILNGKVKIQGKVDGATLCLLRVDDEVLARKEGRETSYKDLYFFIENRQLEFTTPHVDSLPQGYGAYDIRKERYYSLRGAAVQDAYYRYQQQTLPYRYEIGRLKVKSEKSQSGDDYEQLFRQQDELDRVAREFIESQRNLEVNLYVANQLKRKPLTYDLIHVEAWEKAFASYPDTCASLREFREYLREAKQFVRGKKMEDAELLTPAGKMTRLSEQLKPEGYTLVDVWASWCGACRVGIPALKELYRRYGDRVKFLSVAVNDMEDAWMRAMREENMPWEQYRDGGELAASMRRCYNTGSIPTLLLVSPEGRVVYRGSRSGEIEVQLKSLVEI